MGLNDSFSNIRGQILLIDPLPSINKVFSLIVQEESQREIFLGSLTHDTAALMTTAVPMQQNRLVKPHNQKEKSICSHCNIPGHTVDKCYRLHGYPPGFKFTKKPPHSGFNKPSACSVGHFQEENSNNYASQPQPQMQLPQVPFTAVLLPISFSSKLIPIFFTCQDC